MRSIGRLSLSVTLAAAVLLLTACAGIRPAGSPRSFSLWLDGVDDYVQVPDAEAYDYGRGDFTIEAWVRRTSTGERHEVLSQKDLFNNANHGVSLAVEADDRVYGYLMERPYTRNDVRLVSTRRIGREWTHVALVRAGSRMTLYLDGVAEASAKRPPFDLSSDGPLRIGANRPENAGAETPPRFAFAGLIDEVRVWSVARSPEQLREGMRRRMDGSEPGFELYFPFEEGRASTARDIASGRSGEVRGDPEWTCVTPLPGKI